MKNDVKIVVIHPHKGRIMGKMFLVITSSWDSMYPNSINARAMAWCGEYQCLAHQMVLVYDHALITANRHQRDKRSTPKISHANIAYCVFVIVWELSVLPTSSWTHRRRATHICIDNLTTIGSDKGLSPGRCQAIIWINDGIMLIRTQGTNISEILIEIYKFSFKKMYLKMSSGKWRPSCLGLNVLRYCHFTGSETVIRVPAMASVPMKQAGEIWFQNSLDSLGSLI